MRKFYLFVLAFSFIAIMEAQDLQVSDQEFPFAPAPVVETFVSSVELQSDVIFVGGSDLVQTTPTYNNPAGQALAKQWHDFIGFTPDTTSEDLGWISVNHEMNISDTTNQIGDGGGMTVFKIAKAEDGSIEVVDQTLSDGRSGKFFNVDFVNVVGNTGMNCGGISTPDGRIWTAEEWFRGSNDDINDRDLDPFTIGVGTPSNPATAGFPGFDGETIEKYQNYNYMVEIDPREAVAIRKQYNWGRQPFEGGSIANNTNVFLGSDATPGFFSQFVADSAGDFLSGSLFVYKEDGGATPEDRWVEIDNTNLDNMLNFDSVAISLGATMFNRIEWVAINPLTGKVYFAETGRDNPASRWADEAEAGGVVASHHITRASEQGTTFDAPEYWDYYGRVVEYDPATGAITPYIEGGPFLEESYSPFEWGSIKHLSNPDGINFFVVGEKSYMIICEDLNGTSFGRMPRYIDNRTCELWLLDMDIENPTVDDLTRIGAVPAGAEVTGAIQIDENTMFVNTQHPDVRNPFPHNNSNTVVLTGFADATTTSVVELLDENSPISVYPNPVSQNLFFNEVMKKATVYTIDGKQVSVKENANSVNFQNWTPGVYVVTMEAQDGNVYSAKIIKE